MIFLETPQLLFRPHEARDEQDFVNMHTDPEVRRYVGGQAWPLGKALDRFRTEYLGRPEKTYGLWATVFKEEARYIGCCGLRAPENAEGGASLAFYIARPYWRQGLASEAASAFIAYAFERLELPRISADVEKGNAASERILQKFGFREVGREVLPGRGRIICYYELLKDAWEKNRG